jgi:tripartite-type tricarboxylate transporter receptor subunit TctC
MRLTMRLMRALIDTAMIGAVAAPVAAQIYPAKAVRIVVPFPPGGPADVLGRMVGQKLGERWSQSVVIDNRAGAAGNIGAEVVARSAADGYILLLNASSHVINGSMYTTLGYDPIKDFTPVTEVASYMLVLVVHPSVPAATVTQFVALAKSKPGQISVANTGVGTPTQLAAALFKITAGINLLEVPYKGAAPANTDLLGGQVIAMFNNPINALPYVKVGKLRALAVTGMQRLLIAPELPTIAESGYANFEAGTWYGFLGPARLPSEIVAKIHGDVIAVLRLPDIKQKLAAQGWDSIGNTPAEFAAILKSDFDKWAKVVKAAGLRAD